MRNIITVPRQVEQRLKLHLFQNELEQGAFLYARAVLRTGALRLEVCDLLLVDPTGWEVQCEGYLQMRDAERARLMKLARDQGLCVVDCHSHPGSRLAAWFSPSDKRGTVEFAAYAKWKLGGRPYASMVWGEDSIDAVLWHGNFLVAQPVDAVEIVGDGTRVLTPRGTWFEGWHPRRDGLFHGR